MSREGWEDLFKDKVPTIRPAALRRASEVTLRFEIDRAKELLLRAEELVKEQPSDDATPGEQLRHFARCQEFVLKRLYPGLERKDYAEMIAGRLRTVENLAKQEAMKAEPCA